MPPRPQGIFREGDADDSFSLATDKDREKIRTQQEKADKAARAAFEAHQVGGRAGGRAVWMKASFFGILFVWGIVSCYPRGAADGTSRP